MQHLYYYYADNIYIRYVFLFCATFDKLQSPNFLDGIRGSKYRC